MEKQIIKLEDLTTSNLPELLGWAEKQETLVKENPYVEITDNKSYELACKSRTNLLKGRTELEKQDKAIASKLTSFRKQVADETAKLILITQPSELKQQIEVKRFEEIKELEKQEKQRLEDLRIDTIKNKVVNFESECLVLIQRSNFENVNETKSKLDSLFNSEFDFEEFDVLFEMAKTRIQNQFDVKCADIQEKETTRVENERLKAEKEESDRKLKELQDKESERLKSAEKERLERESERKSENDAVFEIRKNRLSELGFILNIEGVFVVPLLLAGVAKESIYECSAVDFEEIINDAKKSIQVALQKKEDEDAQFEISQRKAKMDHENKLKENSKRIKRLKSDKEIISKSLETYFADLHLDSKNKESVEFVEMANIKIQELKKELLIELKNL